MKRQKVRCSFAEYSQVVVPAIRKISKGWFILNIDLELEVKNPCLEEKWRWLFQQLASPYGDIILKAHQAKYGVSDWQNNTQKGNSSL